MTAVVTAGALTLTGLAALPAGAADGTQTVSYRGVTVQVPSDWPVVRLAGQQGCVRFDRHAVYLGNPTTSTCPADVSGHVEAVHITGGQTDDARSPLADVGKGRAVTGGTTIHPDFVVSHRRSPVEVVVTAGTDEGAAKEVADSVSYDDASLQQSALAQPAPKSFSASGSSAASPSLKAAAARGTSTFTGRGFDTCLTPSSDAIAAWQASPYRAVNMYIGGASRGCPNQPNLSASWVETQVARGWTLIPTYVGLQASCSKYTHRISTNLTTAAAQGKSSADDAIAILNSLGLGPGSIVYFDIEAYDYTNAGCVKRSQAFLDAWTTRLNARSYLSGIYTSSNTMNATLVARQGDSSFNQPDDIWFARWNNSASTTGDPMIPDQYWANHQRIHQYKGGHTETYGKVTINIDSNQVDADTSPGAPPSDGTFVRQRGTDSIFRMAGGAPIYVSSWAPFGGPQPTLVVSKTWMRLLRTFPRTGTFLQAAGGAYVYRVSAKVAATIPSWEPYGGPQPLTVVDPKALNRAGTGGHFNHLLSGRPSAGMTGKQTAVFRSSTGRATWQSPVLSSAVRNYDVRYQRARFTTGFSAWSRPKSWQHRHATSRSITLPRGYDYCFSVRARNWAGGVSGWTSRHCLTRPLDDRSLSPSASWHEGRSTRYMAKTFMSTRTQRATLRLSSATVRRVGVVATVCRTCGRVAVAVNGKRVGVIDLAGAHAYRQVLLLPKFSRRRGPVTLRVLSSGQPVRIDGLVVSRT